MGCRNQMRRRPERSVELALNPVPFMLTRPLLHTFTSAPLTSRLAVGSTGTQLVHIQQAWRAIQEAATRVLAAHHS